MVYLPGGKSQKRYAPSAPVVTVRLTGPLIVTGTLGRPNSAGSFTPLLLTSA